MILGCYYARSNVFECGFNKFYMAASCVSDGLQVKRAYLQVSVSISGL